MSRIGCRASLAQLENVRDSRRFRSGDDFQRFGKYYLEWHDWCRTVGGQCWSRWTDTFHSSSKVFQLKNGTGGNLGISFGVFVQQRLASNNLTGYVGLNGKANMGFLFNFVSGKVKRVSCGARISALAAGVNSNFQGGLPQVFTRNRTQSGFADSHGGWAQHSGFAGFEFTKDSVTDYGWVKLSFTTTANGATGIPEPSTADLAILAARAAGIVGLRCRRLKSN